MSHPYLEKRYKVWPDQDADGNELSTWQVFDWAMDKVLGTGFQTEQEAYDFRAECIDRQDRLDGDANIREQELEEARSRRTT